LQQVDSELWAVAPTDFVAHCFDAAECFVQQRCSVVLGARALQPAFSAQVLLNLSDEVAPGFEAFERVIEVVSTDDADRERARRRWRNYSEQGYKITRHDLALKNSG
jgi:DNA polymerase-3 subunit chi